MKTTVLASLLLLFSSPALAAALKPFPDDYKVHPCAPESACNSWSQSRLTEGAAALRGYSLSVDWVQSHWDEMMAAFKPICAKIGSCYAMQGNSPTFCTDLLTSEVYGLCESYALGTEDRRQCDFFVRAYSVGYDMQDRSVVAGVKKCIASKPPLTGPPRPIDVWMTPAKIDETYDGKLRVYAIDRETRVPIEASVFIGGERLTTKDPPSGKSETHYLIFWNGKLLRVPNQEGHTDLVAPVVRVQADGYEPVEFTMPVPVPKMIVEMNPPAKKLKRGTNAVTFKAWDAATGKPVEARVMAGDRILGATNKPLQLELKRGQKRPEIWATSLFDRYGDVVVLPREK